MSTGIADLFESERGTWAIGTFLFAAVLLFIGKISSDQWIDLMKFLSGALIVSKTVTTSVETRTKVPQATVVSGGDK